MSSLFRIQTAYCLELDLSGTKRKYSESDPNKIFLDDETIEKILQMLSSKNIDDIKLAVALIKQCNDDIKYLQLLEKISRKFRIKWNNKDKGGSIRAFIRW